MSAALIPAQLLRVEAQLREGRFQRWLSLVAALSSTLSGLEVGYEHYKGSYSQPVMYTPVVLSTVLAASGAAGFFSRRAATTVLRGAAAVTLADSLAGFFFHIRGVARKPGGWRLPVTNIVMGPPVFAPLLFGVAAYLGLLASFLRRENDYGELLPKPAHRNHWAARIGRAHERIGWKQDLREGRFQKHLAVVTAFSAFFSGFEAWYSHYKNNFRFKAQWTPVILAPLLIASALGAIANRKVAHTWLPAVSGLALMDGGVGFFYHARGILRRPGGMEKPFYNVIYGPPIFAPLLFAACGFLGLLASLLRREAR